MVVVTRAKKRSLEEEERLVDDRISSLPDDVLGDIVSLLPTKAGARTQVLSSRWRHIWRSAPLNVDLNGWRNRTDNGDEITHVLSTHPGPGRRFSIPKGYFWDASHAAALDLDCWLRSPALENLQELKLDLSYRQQLWSSPPIPQPPLPAPVYRFSSSLRRASFGCCIMPDGNDAGALRLPVLEQMTLCNVKISERSLHALLTGCTVLQSLLLYKIHGFSQLQIVSPSLRSIGVGSSYWFHLVIKDMPCLEKLLFFGQTNFNISVVSAPRLGIFFDRATCPWPQFRSTIFQGSTPISTMIVLHSVKILALCELVLTLDAVIDTIKYFPHLEKLLIKVTHVSVDNASYDKYQKHIGTHDIRLRKVVLANYHGSKTDINFVKFFLSNARVLESMRLGIEVENIDKAWVARQHRLLDIKIAASRGAQITFVSRRKLIGPLDQLVHDLRIEQLVHDLSIDPFERFR